MKKLTKGNFCTALIIMFLASLCIWAGVRFYASCKFDTTIDGYLDNYAESGTLEEAEKNLSLALEALEDRNLTSGQISIFFNNPNENLGIWYQNLVSSRDELSSALTESPVKQSIILDKQKTWLSDGGKHVSKPDGIEIYPYNKQFFWWSIISLLGLILSYIVYHILDIKYEKNKNLLKKINK